MNWVEQKWKNFIEYSLPEKVSTEILRKLPEYLDNNVLMQQNLQQHLSRMDQQLTITSRKVCAHNVN